MFINTYFFEKYNISSGALYSEPFLFGCFWEFKNGIHNPYISCQLGNTNLTLGYEIIVSNNLNFTPMVRKVNYLRYYCKYT